MDQQEDALAFAKCWDQVESGWWYRVAGPFEVHLSLDRDLGWEISVRENRVLKSRPVFRKELAVAINVAEGLFAHYEALSLAEGSSIAEAA